MRDVVYFLSYSKLLLIYQTDLFRFRLFNGIQRPINIQQFLYVFIFWKTHPCLPCFLLICADRPPSHAHEKRQYWQENLVPVPGWIFLLCDVNPIFEVWVKLHLSQLNIFSKNNGCIKKYDMIRVNHNLKCVFDECMKFTFYLPVWDFSWVFRASLLLVLKSHSLQANILDSLWLTPIWFFKLALVAT